jgi:hypothetical protein
VQQLKDTNSHQKKRVSEMMINLMKDINDVGAALGGLAGDLKVCVSCLLLQVST